MFILQKIWKSDIFVTGHDVEYDEPSHEKPSIKEKDIIRQNYIIKELNCKFYRYSEKNDTLYEVFYQ